MRINTHIKHLELGWALVKYSVSVLHCYYLTTNKGLCLKEHLWLTSVISFIFLACRHWLFHPLTQGMYSRGERRGLGAEVQGGGDPGSYRNQWSFQKQGLFVQWQQKPQRWVQGRPISSCRSQAVGKVSSDLWEGCWGRSQLQRARARACAGGEGVGREHHCPSEKSGQPGLYLEEETHVLIFKCRRSEQV